MEPIYALSDEALIKLYKDTHNMECIGLLYNRYSHLVLGICMKVLKEEQAALDQTMQIFEKLVEILKSSSIINFNKWLYISTKNACISKIRKTQREKKHIIGWNGDILEPVSDEPSYEEITDQQIESENLRLAIEQLKPDQKQCIMLFFFEEKTYKEIAQITGFEEPLIKSYLQNGKRNLRSFLS
ncbi:MAG TPA: sigma-70 family RNA polymerase sigma factor [Saprospiraceae bacterium]|nr:sigma-70 family RNA polymerase sigma factor [Saprospiraceae bacterium]